MKTTITIVFIFITAHAIAQVDPVDKKGLAIGGYDVVAYFQSNKPIKGLPQFKKDHNGTTYYFSTSENQKTFSVNPEKYIPQYDGYCALAVSYGKKISIDPETFKVKDNKLYLFYNGNTSRGKVNSIDVWNKNEARLLKKAESLWPDVKKKKYKPEDTF